MVLHSQLPHTHSVCPSAPPRLLSVRGLWRVQLGGDA
jgi:hypothetical protein